MLQHLCYFENIGTSEWDKRPFKLDGMQYWTLDPDAVPCPTTAVGQLWTRASLPNHCWLACTQLGTHRLLRLYSPTGQ